MGRDMAKLIIPIDLRPAHREGLAHYLATGASNTIDRRFETTAMRADGTQFPVELSISRIPTTGQPMFTGFLRDITTQRQLLEQLSFRAAHDGLTKSLNRTAIMDRLRAAASRAGDKRSIAVLFVDIDQFKGINDRYGHVVGDQLLVALAGRLHGCVRPIDTVARLGGDEFAILVEKVTDPADVTAVAERIKQALSTPFNLDGLAVTATASLGIAFGSSESLPEDLLRAADEEICRAKAIGLDSSALAFVVAQVLSPAVRSQGPDSLRLRPYGRRALTFRTASTRSPASSWEAPRCSVRARRNGRPPPPSPPGAVGRRPPAAEAAVPRRGRSTRARR